MRRIGALGLAAIAPACTDATEPMGPAEPGAAARTTGMSAGSPNLAASVGGDVIDTLTLRTPGWDGGFVPPIQYTRNENTGWMPHPAGIGAFSFIQSGREVFRFSNTPEEAMITAPNTGNRFSFSSSQGFTFYARSGTFELEAPGEQEICLIGYRMASYSGKSIVVTTSAAEPVVPLICRGEGNVNIWEGHNSEYKTVCSFDKAGNLAIDGKKVAGARGAPVASVAGADAGPAYDAQTRELINELKAQVNTLLSRLRATTGHGLIEG